MLSSYKWMVRLQRNIFNKFSMQTVLKFAFENLNIRLLEARHGNFAITKNNQLILLEWLMMRLPKSELSDRVVKVLDESDGNCYEAYEGVFPFQQATHAKHPEIGFLLLLLILNFAILFKFISKDI